MVEFEISIHFLSLVIGFILGLTVMSILIITFELFDFDRTGVDITKRLIKLEAELTKLKKEEV